MGHDSGYYGFRPRLQRRDRDGLAPSSLLNPHAYGYLNPLVIKEPTLSLSEHLRDQHPVSKLDALFEAWTVHKKISHDFYPISNLASIFMNRLPFFCFHRRQTSLLLFRLGLSLFLSIC